MYFYTATHSLEFYLRGEFFENSETDGNIGSMTEMDLLTSDEKQIGKIHLRRDKNEEIHGKEVGGDGEDHSFREDFLGNA